MSLLLLVASGVAAWGSVLWAQEIDKPLIDDVSKQVPKDVTTLPEPTSKVPAPPVPTQEQKQIQLDLLLMELDLNQLPAIKDEKSKQERLAKWADKLGWTEQHRGVDWKTKQGLDHKLFEGESSKLGKVQAAPKTILVSGREASFLSGGSVPVVDDEQADKVVDMRPFGFSMKCLATVRRSGLVRLDLKLENSQRVIGDEPSAAQVAVDALGRLLGGTDTKTKANDPALVVGQTVSLIAELASGESYVVALPHDKDAANKVLLVSVTPQELTSAKGFAQDLPLPRTLPSPSQPIVGKGINSDAGVTGNIVLADKATQATLRAESLSIEVPQVYLGYGMKVGQRGLLVARQKLGERDYHLRIIAQPVVLETIKNMDSKHRFQADVTLRAESQQAAEQLGTARQPLAKDETLSFVPLPDGMKQVAPADLRRVFEHASIRAEVAQGRAETANAPFDLIEVPATQKTVRAAINRQIIALLQTPTGNSSEYVAIFHSEQRGVRRIAGLTVFFVTEAAIELEALLKETEPEAKVTVIEVRESALLRGSVESAEQKKAVVELAEQFYPKVLDQLRVGKTVTYEKIGIDFENGEKPITTVTTVTERTEPLQSPLVPQQPEAIRRSPEPATNPKSSAKPSPIQQVKAEEIETLASGAKRLKKQAPQKLPSVEELKELRDDVKGLRRDVQRLSELLQKQGSTRSQAQLGNAPTKALLPEPATPVVTSDEENGTGSGASRAAFPSGAWERMGQLADPKLAHPENQLVTSEPSGCFVITLDVGRDEMVTFARRMKRIEGFDSAMLDVKAVSSERMQLRGKKPGLTVMQVTFDKQQTQKLSVLVANKVSIDVDDQPLREVIKSLASQAGINVSIDAAALEEEGVAPSSPVSISLKDVSVWQALRSVLSPQNLVMQLDGEIIAVTSAVRAQGRPITAAYPVADLVVPVQAASLDAPDQKPITKESSQALIELIRSTIEPNSWSEVGGKGAIKFDEQTLSLVIHQSQQVHDQIKDLLGQLRRLQDKQVVLESQLISTPEANLPAVCRGENPLRTIVLSSTDQQHYRDTWVKDRHSNILMAPKVTLFNGQTATINFGAPAMPLLLRGTASGDNKIVGLSVGLNGESFEKATRRQDEKLQVGQSLLLDLTDDLSAAAELLKKLPVAADTDEASNILKKFQPHKGERVLLLVTPRVIEVEEEELQQPERLK